jgi:hypothetical protein
MSAADATSDQEPESPDAKEDRQLIELLNELRVALPGVQMLFGFMLAVPFTQPFGSLTDRQRFLFYVAFLATAAASICFITPASFHRITWQHGVKGLMLRISSGLTIADRVPRRRDWLRRRVSQQLPVRLGGCIDRHRRGPGADQRALVFDPARPPRTPPPVTTT